MVYVLVVLQDQVLKVVVEEASTHRKSVSLAFRESIPGQDVDHISETFELERNFSTVPSMCECSKLNIKNKGQHIKMVSMLASGPSCPRFDSQHSRNIF